MVLCFVLLLFFGVLCWCFLFVSLCDAYPNSLYILLSCHLFVFAGLLRVGSVVVLSTP